MNISKMDIRDAFFDEICEIASKDKNVIFITADADAFSLRKFKKDFPNQFINVGVAEQNMIAVAAGLALSGKKVFIYAIIPFITIRCYEHIKVNICGMNLPVTIIGAGSGLSFGYDGPTHHAVQDIAVMRILPEMTIYNPCDSQSAFSCAKLAHQSKTPVYVRIDKGTFPEIYDNTDDFSCGLKVVRELSKINILSTGYMTSQSLLVSDVLKKQAIDVGVIDIMRIKPINEELLFDLIDSSQLIITIEENSIIGGIGTMISELLSDKNKKTTLARIALNDKQMYDYGDREWLHKKYHIDMNSITQKINSLLWKRQFYQNNQ